MRRRFTVRSAEIMSKVMTDLYYEVSGAGSPVVLAHDALLDCRSWDMQMPTFTARHRVLRFDARGLGQSPDPHAKFDAVEDLLAVMAAGGIQSAHMVGRSAGAVNMLGAAFRRPSAVRSLTLVAPGIPGSHPKAPANSRWGPWRAAVDAGDYELAVAEALRLWLVGPDRTLNDIDLGTRETVERLVRDNWAHHTSRNFPAGEVPLSVQQLGRLRLPVLVIVGGCDESRPKENARAVTSAIPGARLTIVPNTGHEPQIEDPTVFNALVLDFLAAVDE